MKTTVKYRSLRSISAAWHSKKDLTLSLQTKSFLPHDSHIFASICVVVCENSKMAKYVILSAAVSHNWYIVCTQQ